MCCVFLMITPFLGVEEVVSGLLPPGISQINGASEIISENTIFVFLSLVDMRTDSLLKKFKGALTCSSPGGEERRMAIRE